MRTSSKNNTRLLRALLAAIVMFCLLAGAPASKVRAAGTIIVNNTNDSGPESLRQAISTASPGDIITFDPSLTGSITITSGEMVIVQSLTIDASNLGKNITIDGNNNSRIFNVSPDITVTFKNLDITQGNDSSGSAIFNMGQLTLIDCYFYNNITLRQSGYEEAMGGAILNVGVLTVQNSTFIGNVSADLGGAIYNGGQMTVKNSTLYSNTATASYGGAIYTDFADSYTTIQNSTFSNNSAFDDRGSDIAIGYGTMKLQNSILANPQQTGGSNPAVNCMNLFGSFIGNDNLMESNATSPNNCGTPTVIADPKLASPAFNGGPTFSMALQNGSPAIDKAENATCLGSDQRGVPRPIDGDFNGSSVCDLGAYELKTGKKTIKSQAKYDGWVLESGESSGKGGTKNNTDTLLQVGDDALDKQYRAILSFGTAGIPDNADIAKVILKVRKAGVTGTNPLNSHNGLVVDIIKGKFYTLPALQLNDFQANPDMFKAGKFSKQLFSGWHRAVLYTGALDYINVKGSTQLRLRFLLDDNDDNGADILKLYSGNAILAYRPKLIVQYYVP